MNQTQFDIELSNLCDAAAAMGLEVPKITQRRKPKAAKSRTDDFGRGFLAGTRHVVNEIIGELALKYEIELQAA